MKNSVALGLNTDFRVEYDDNTIDDTEGALHFNREINVTGSVNEIDLVIVPPKRNSGCSDGNTTFHFFRHEIRSCVSFIDFSDTALHARVEEEAFGRRCLSGINVCDDSKVSSVADFLLFSETFWEFEVDCDVFCLCSLGSVVVAEGRKDACITQS